MFKFTVYSKSKKIPEHNFMYNKFDARFVDVMISRGHFKSLKREMESDFRPNNDTKTLPLYEEILKHLD